MGSIQAKAKQSEAIARASIGRLSDERLAETWMLTNGQTSTRAVTITRGWLMDELEKRMGQVDVWADLYPATVCDYDGDQGAPVNPLPYLT